MTTDPLLPLKERICELYETEELLDFLNLGAMDILNAFEPELLQCSFLMNVEVEE
jgi:hypothetical protein